MKISRNRREIDYDFPSSSSSIFSMKNICIGIGSGLFLINLLPSSFLRLNNRTLTESDLPFEHPIGLPQPTTLLLGIFTSDGEAERLRRKRIRETYLNRPSDPRTCTLSKFITEQQQLQEEGIMPQCRVPYAFIKGGGPARPKDHHDNAPLIIRPEHVLNPILGPEARANDIVYLNISDNEHVGKSSSYLKWASDIGSTLNIDYIAKTPTDTLLHIDLLIDFLNKDLAPYPMNRRIYGGSTWGDYDKSLMYGTSDFYFMSRDLATYVGYVITPEKRLDLSSGIDEARDIGAFIHSHPKPIKFSFLTRNQFWFPSLKTKGEWADGWKKVNDLPIRGPAMSLHGMCEEFQDQGKFKVDGPKSKKSKKEIAESTEVEKEDNTNAEKEDRNDVSMKTVKGVMFATEQEAASIKANDQKGSNVKEASSKDKIATSVDSTEVEAMSVDVVDERPKMYTFFQRIPSKERSTGMEDSQDDALLESWREKWTSAGWDPEIINLDHAKQHPRYDEYFKKLQKVQMNGVEGKGMNRNYNELCFLRWLAMASVGGGWMSDYDLFPLGYGSGNSKPQPPQLSHDGEFTVYSIVPDSQGAGIPCLVSGSAREWERLAFSLLENAIKHKDDSHWTDMFSLIDIRFDQAYKWYDDVIDGKYVLLGREWETNDCQITAGKRAVHFSHDAMDNGDISYIEGVTGHANDRPQLVQHWLEKWDSTCEI